MKLAFIRSIDIQQMAPYLNQIAGTLDRHAIEAKLFYTDGSCSPGEFPGESIKMPATISPRQLADAVRGWGAEAVVSLSIPDENTLRDAIVKKLFSFFGVEVITHNADTACLFANKWDTKQVVSRFGLSTSPSMLIDGDLLNDRAIKAPAYIEYIRERCADLEYPLVCKPLWECLGNGIRYLESERDLDRYLQDPYNGNIIIERCLIGDLVSIEIIGHDGEYVFQPSIWKGQSSLKPRLAFTRVMHNPCDAEAAAALHVVKEKLLSLCRHLDVCGAIEVEMIYADGTFHILEINPRVSGSTSLFIASSGFNTYNALINIAIGQWQTYSKSYRGRTTFALQFPYIGTTHVAPQRLSDEVQIIRASNFSIDGIDRPNAIISCSRTHIASVPSWLNERFTFNPDTQREIIDICAKSDESWDEIIQAEFPQRHGSSPHNPDYTLQS